MTCRRIGQWFLFNITSTALIGCVLGNIPDPGNRMNQKNGLGHDKVADIKNTNLQLPRVVTNVEGIWNANLYSNPGLINDQPITGLIKISISNIGGVSKNE